MGLMRLKHSLVSKLKGMTLNRTVTQILRESHSIRVKPGGKVPCPFCGHHTFSVKDNNEIGKCFHPTCEKVIKAERGGGGISIPVKTNTKSQNLSGCSLEDYSEAKAIPIPFLESLGITQISYLSKTAIRIPYFDASGDEKAIRFRTSLKKTDGKDNRFRWKKGSKPVLYGLWKLNDARDKGYVVIVEGESDAHTLWFHDIPAIGLPGAGTWKEEWAENLTGISKVFVVIEPDSGGEAVKKWLACSKIKDRCFLMSIKGYKDPSELHCEREADFGHQMQESINEAVPFNAVHNKQIASERELLWKRCESIARPQNILTSFSNIISDLGLVGECRNAKILYLALTSRVLKRPISVAVKGPSSCGKSYVVENVLKLFPESAYHSITAMSERALAYSEEPISNRFLVIYESSGVENDFISYLLRSLLSEGCVRYETVDKTKEGLKAKLIEREGPTGLIITTTSLSLHPENETRILTIPINDTPEQTAIILLAIANDSKEIPDLDQWIAFQLWLEKSDKDVAIPYAAEIAKLLPSKHVRLRRDFTQILNLIKTHAIIHQVNRHRDSAGRIIANLDDYVAVKVLIDDVISTGLQVTIPGGVREIVRVLEELYTPGSEGVTIKQMASKMDLDQSVVNRRLRQAMEGGYAEKMTIGNKKPFRFKPAEPLPEDAGILPRVEQIGSCNLADPLNTGIDHNEKAEEQAPWESILEKLKYLPMPSTKAGGILS